MCSGRPPTLWCVLIVAEGPRALTDSITSGYKVPCVAELVGLFVEDLDEQVADDLALGFRIADAGERAEVAVARVDADHAHAQAMRAGGIGEGRHDLVALAQPQQAGVDEHAGQLRADRLVQQRGDDGRIHAARQAEDHFVAAHLLADARDLVVDDVGRGPQRGAAADVDDEAAQQREALLGVSDFGMELHAVPALGLKGERGHRHALGAGGDGELRRRGADVVAVAHPHVETRRRAGMVRQTFEQTVLRDDRDFGVAVFARVGGFGLAAQLLGHRLHAVADAQQRQAAVEHVLRRARRAVFSGRFGAARQDDALGRERGDLGRIMVPGPDFAVDAQLADAAGDQLCVLRAEIEDEDFVAVEIVGL